MTAQKEREHTLGTTVQYTKKFLKSIGAGPTDDLWRMKGEVIDFHQWGDGRKWPMVRWVGEAEAKMVHPNNVAVGHLANVE